ncbi:hypothetical protein [Cryobacterium mannosilyticum]|uniref:Uncharacterized protein n=1 Tax=Cryobacterium mannosilyticum TaxID=1259190 RepID=A0A4R8W173_9MICO|nr:hypothetical protein [Cryobacterium mannosilyticum]TFC00520.1 hypothetical protein E3O32_15335 [Cryobacterium mannosilyticum]
MDPPPEDGYPSAWDVPQFKEMRVQMRAMTLLLVIRPSLRKQLAELKKEMHRIVGSVDRFYELVGDRHWVFHGSLNLERLVTALDTGSCDEVEKELIEQYQDAKLMRFALVRAKAVPELRPYAALLDSAWRDYQEERYYAVVLTLLPILDGFVATVGDNRRGLHTREEHELVVWNSMISHHKGLAATQQSFRKSFNTLNEEPLHELYRNGILHGNFTNYDNVIVASKAWNRLFTLLDWREALIESAKPKAVERTLKESFAKLADTREMRRQMDDWQPRASSVADDGEDVVMGEPVVQAVVALLDAWRAGNYGKLADYLYETMKKPSRGAYIGQVRSRFAVTALEGFTIDAVEMRGSGCGHVKTTLMFAGKQHSSELRMLHVDAAGHVSPEGDERASWHTIQTSPEAIIGREWPPVT